MRLKCLPDALPPFHTKLQRRLDCGRADAAGGSIDNSEQACVIVWIREHTHVGEHVFDFATIEETLPAHDPIWNLEAAKILLEQTRLRVHPEENRETFPNVRLTKIATLNFFGDELRFLPIRRTGNEPHLVAALARAPKVLGT